MAIRKQKKSKTKKLLWKILISGLVVILVASVWITVARHSRNQKAALAGSVAEASKPTPAEQQVGNDQKQRDLDREKIDTAPSPSGSQTQTVTPVITFADVSDGNLEVGAFVPGIYEDGGTCTLTAQNGGQTITVHAAALKTATTTNCRSLTIPVSSFPVKGTWSLTVSYSSATNNGTSAARSIEIK